MSYWSLFRKRLNKHFSHHFIFAFTSLGCLASSKHDLLILKAAAVLSQKIKQIAKTRVPVIWASKRKQFTHENLLEELKISSERDYITF